MIVALIVAIVVAAVVLEVTRTLAGSVLLADLVGLVTFFVVYFAMGGAL